MLIFSVFIDNTWRYYLSHNFPAFFQIRFIHVRFYCGVDNADRECVGPWPRPRTWLMYEWADNYNMVNIRFWKFPLPGCVDHFRTWSHSLVWRTRAVLKLGVAGKPCGNLLFGIATASCFLLWIGTMVSLLLMIVIWKFDTILRWVGRVFHEWIIFVVFVEPDIGPGTLYRVIWVLYFKEMLFLL